MKLHYVVAPAFAALALATAPASAQTSATTKVTHDTNVDDNGVATRTTKVVHTTKHKTRRPKKILGVKVGHKTVKTKTVRETSASTDGDVTNSVKTTH